MSRTRLALISAVSYAPEWIDIRSSGPVRLSAALSEKWAWGFSLLAHLILLLLLLGGGIGIYQKSDLKNAPPVSYAVLFTAPIQAVIPPTAPPDSVLRTQAPSSAPKLKMPAIKDAALGVAKPDIGSMENGGADQDSMVMAAPSPSMPVAAESDGGLFQGLPLLPAPQFLRRDPPLYPPVSVSNGEQGTVLIRAQIDGTGHPQEILIWQSSGYAGLDRAAKQAVQRWQFVAAKINGQATNAWIEVPVHFVLN